MNGCFLEDKKYYKSKDYVIISMGRFDYLKNFPWYYKMFDRDITRIIDCPSEEDYSINYYIVGNNWEPCNAEEIKRVNELLVKNNLGFSSLSAVNNLVVLENFKQGSLIESVGHENFIIVLDKVDEDFVYYQARLTPESFEIKEGKLSRLDYKNWIIPSHESRTLMNHLLNESGYKLVGGKLAKLHYFISTQTLRVQSVTNISLVNEGVKVYPTYRDAEKDLRLIEDRIIREKYFIDRMKNSAAGIFYYLDKNLTIKSCVYSDSKRKFLSEQLSKFNAFCSELEALDFKKCLQNKLGSGYLNMLTK